VSIIPAATMSPIRDGLAVMRCRARYAGRGVLQSEQSCKHVETHEATLLERFQNPLQRTGHDPTGLWEKQEPMFSFLQSLLAGFFPDHAARPMNGT
jgi:hypothetical protein